MYVAESAHLISLVLAMFMIAAAAGFLVATVAFRGRRRARGFFVLGFSSGLLTGAVLRGRRQGGRMARALSLMMPTQRR